MDPTATFFSAVERGDVEAVRALVAAHPALVSARDATGATALHHAAFHGHRSVAELLHAAGADLNARDGTHDATPAGWAIHYLRERGALLAVEVEDAVFAIRRGDAELIARLLARHPALAGAADRDGTSLAAHAAAAAAPAIRRLFGLDRSGAEA
jgi:ankyrin repeat protein